MIRKGQIVAKDITKFAVGAYLGFVGFGLIVKAMTPFFADIPWYELVYGPLLMAASTALLFGLIHGITHLLIRSLRRGPDK
jgi:hypothetical protein